MKNELDALIRQINRKAKDNIVFKLGSDVDLETSRIPLGVESIDRIMGGGLPTVGVVEIYGRESSGKTLLACHATKSFQDSNKSVIYVDAENTLEPSRLSHFNIDLNNLAFSQESGAESVMKMIASMVSSDYPPGLIVVDSIASLSPMQEEPGEISVAPLARVMSRDLRAINAQNKSTLLLFINQIRQDISPYGGMVTPSGNAIKHYAKIRLEISKGQLIREGTKIIGHKIKVKCAKNKTAVPAGDTILDYYLDTGIDLIDDRITIGLQDGDITRAGPYYSYNNGKYLGRDKLREAMQGELNATVSH